MDELDELKIQLRVAQRRIRELEEVLEFYARPETYFAIGIFPDHPCGEFIDDYSQTYREADGLDVIVPGKRARLALE